MQGRVLLILEVKVLIDYTFLSGAWLSDSWVLYHLFLLFVFLCVTLKTFSGNPKLFIKFVLKKWFELHTFNFNVDWWIINYFGHFIYDHEFKIFIIVESTYNWLSQTTSTSYVYHYKKYLAFSHVSCSMQLIW